MMRMANFPDPNLAHYVLPHSFCRRRTLRDRMEPQSSSSSGGPESAGNREDKLWRERARRASEAVEQTGEERLRTRRTRDRRSSDRGRYRAAGLQQRRHRRVTETTEVREVRLAQLNACQHARLAAETDEEREARLQWMRDRLAIETDE